VIPICRLRTVTTSPSENLKDERSTLIIYAQD
jgi:hypothetical protein